jgi:hypothetical protein
MKLAGTVIRSNDQTLPILNGRIRVFHLDQRSLTRQSPPNPPMRRRKPPAEVQVLIGTGRLCVAKGEFEILVSDVRRHQPGNSLRLELTDMTMFITHLSDAVQKGEVQRWSFVALFEPTTAQRLWIESLNPPPPAEKAITEPPPRTIHSNLRGRAVFPLVTGNEVLNRDPLTEFLHELAGLNDSSS